MELNKVFYKLILGFQVIVTFLLLMAIYASVVLLYADFGMDSVVGLLFFHPLIGSLLSMLTIMFCYFIGLPMRRSARASAWWRRNYVLAIIGIIAGIAMIIVACLPSMSETMLVEKDGAEAIEQVPNNLLAVSGWILLAFMSMHFFPQRYIEKKMQNVMKRFGGQVDDPGKHYINLDQ